MVTPAGYTLLGGDSGVQPQLPADRGLIAWTQPPYVLTGGSLLGVAGALHLRRLRRVPACSVTSIVTYVGGAGSALTSGQCFAALYTAAGELIAQSVDQATAWASQGVKTMTLAGGPYTLPGGDYYIGVWFNGTTAPAIARSASYATAMTNVGLSAPNFEAATANTGVTTTAPASLGTQTTSMYEYWFALA